MRKISRKFIALISTPIGFILSLVSSCSAIKIGEPHTSLYGPPPPEISEERSSETPIDSTNKRSIINQYKVRRAVVYGPPPTTEKVVKDSTKRAK